MNSIRSWLRTRPDNPGREQAARTAVDSRQVPTAHGSNCICHRCRRAS